MAYIKRTKSEGKIAHKKTIIDGIQFDSKMESEYYLYLKEEQKAGRVKSFTLQPEFILQPKYFVLNGEIVTSENEEYYAIKDKERKAYNKANPDNKIKIVQAIKYRSDFDVIYADGSRKIIDPKGVKTADFKLKEKMFAFRYPHLTLECVMYDGPSKTWMTYDEYREAVKERKKNTKKTTKNKTTTRKKSTRKKKK